MTHCQRRYRLSMPILKISDEGAMRALGHSWGSALAEHLLSNSQSGNPASGYVFFLSGEIGSGKTTLVQGILAGLGFDGVVSSPTYTIVEPYNINQRSIYHFDLYRLKCAEELEMIGIRDMITAETISLIEWPDRGAGLLPEPDYEIVIRYMLDSSCGAQAGREINITSHNKLQLK